MMEASNGNQERVEAVIFGNGARGPGYPIGHVIGSVREARRGGANPACGTGSGSERSGGGGVFDRSEYEKSSGSQDRMSTPAILLVVALAAGLGCAVGVAWLSIRAKSKASGALKTMLSALDKDRKHDLESINAEVSDASSPLEFFQSERKKRQL